MAKRSSGASPSGEPPPEGSSRAEPPAESSSEAEPPAEGSSRAEPPAERREATPGRRPTPGRSLSSADLERVIRRASDLQFRAGTAETESALDEAEVLRIGEEVGLEPRHVRQALAEIHADSLVPVLPRESALPARLWGSGLVRAGRVVPGGRAEVTAKLEGHLEERELLKRVRHQPGRSLWETAGGLLSTMKRAMDVGGHGYELAKARSVEIAVEGLEPGWSLVTLTADLRNQRAEAAVAWHIGGLGVGISAAVGFALGGVPELVVLLGGGLTGTAGLGAATWATSRHYEKRRERARLVLEGLLDRLELGEPLSAPSASWREKLLR